MTKMQRVWATGLALGLLAAGLWAWQAHRVQVRHQRLQAWQGYLRGPLSDLLMGTSRGKALLLTAQKKPLGKADRKELAEAISSVRQAGVEARALLPDWEADAFFKYMLKATGWHAELADAAEDWGRLADGARPLIPTALDAEASMRRGLAGALQAQRELVLDRLHPSQDQLLEMNAMIYALKE